MEINYEKLCKLMSWEQAKGEKSYEDTFLRQEIKTADIPHAKIIDVVYSNGLIGWAKNQNFKSLEEVEREVLKGIFRHYSIFINSYRKPIVTASLMLKLVELPKALGMVI